MDLTTYVILSEKSWSDRLFERLQARKNESWIRISEREGFTLKALNEIKPDIIFIPHWSYKIPKEIYKRFDCVVFHMTDLPYGRGGSPLQNLIASGHTDTKVSSLKVCEEMDAGDIYIKEGMSLYGSAEEIYLRAGKIIGEMIERIIDDNISPVPQEGEPLIFKRRTPEMSNLSGIGEIDKLFDHIRMLDAEAYPHAFVESGGFRFEFSRASLKANGSIVADVKITRK